ncbi:hypothetical protein AAT19DRAFT_12574 [Rhodotorula toruloides]|uniref:Uncharacterized protein n=1 Tax=Rhodotorula toruloides TaxID=5286 RepID=A0A2T0AGM8_RHOTO|nr:hypothetical protein AAT19DRAFT_12574 [Rhodotorula toruloides]
METSQTSRCEGGRRLAPRRSEDDRRRRLASIHLDSPAILQTFDTFNVSSTRLRLQRSTRLSVETVRRRPRNFQLLGQGRGEGSAGRTAGEMELAGAATVGAGGVCCCRCIAAGRTPFAGRASAGTSVRCRALSFRREVDLLHIASPSLSRAAGRSCAQCSCPCFSTPNDLYPVIPRPAVVVVSPHRHSRLDRSHPPRQPPGAGWIAR